MEWWIELILPVVVETTMVAAVMVLPMIAREDAITEISDVSGPVSLSVAGSYSVACGAMAGVLGKDWLS